MTAASRGRLGLLGERNFRLLYVGQLLSGFGDGAATIAVAFAVLGVGGSATALGIVLAARYVPLGAFLLVGGVVGDRVTRRRLMVVSDVVRALSQATLAVLLLSGHAHVWQIAVLQAIYGTAEAFFTPSLNGLVPELVPHDRLPQANALVRSTRSLSHIVGPALGGLLVAAMGPEGAIVADGATFAISAILIAQLMSANAVSATPAPIRLIADLKEGWAEVRSRKWLSCSIGSAAMFNALTLPAVLVLGPELARSELGGVGAWSVLVVAFGAGSLTGSVASLRVRIVRPAAAVAVLLAVACSQPAALASGLGLALIAVLCFAAGMAASMAGIAWISMVQHHVPAGSLSRVDSIDEFGSLILMPVGYLLAGPLASALGLHLAMVVLTVVPLMATLGSLASSDVRRLGPAKVAEPILAAA